MNWWQYIGFFAIGAGFGFSMGMVTCSEMLKRMEEKKRNEKGNEKDGQ